MQRFRVQILMLIIAAVVPATAGLAGKRLEPSSESETRRIVLNEGTILTEVNQPSFVEYNIGELQNYLREITGRKIPVTTSLSSETEANIIIAIGREAAQQVGAQSLPLDNLGEEGFCLKSVVTEGHVGLVITGATPRGTKFGLAQLMKLIQIEGRIAFIEGPVDITTKPSFALRGIHLNGWSHSRPYSFRTWTEDDWKQYIDILSLQGVNLFYLWPFMEIMPIPLSQEDESYLREVRRVVDYAQKQHGMEVWMMQAANRVAKDNLGVADPRYRPYWRPAVHEDLNPADPKQFDRIMKSHEELYRIVNNVDGVCTIDGDPGGYLGSSINDFMQILKGCRTLLNKTNVHGSETKMIHWMLGGWGLPYRRYGEPNFLLEIIRAMKRDVAEPWLLIGGSKSPIPCQQEGVLGKTVYMNYGLEGEPSYPGTNLWFGDIRTSLAIPRDYQTKGVMGNSQCPILQFPNVYYFTATSWDLDYLKKSDQSVLLELGGHLYPAHQELIAECFAALKESDPENADMLAGRLDKLVKEDNLGRLGIFGRKLFPDHLQVARDLVMQLRLQAAQGRMLRTLDSTTDKSEYATVIRDYLDAYLTWDAAHGWHGLWSGALFPFGRLPRPLAAVAARLRSGLGDDASVLSFLDEVGLKLVPKHAVKQVAENGIAPLKAALSATTTFQTPNLARTAIATASLVPRPDENPPRFVNDGNWSTFYGHGENVYNNTDWIQLTWKEPQTFNMVLVYFLRDSSMSVRHVRLQKETTPGRWADGIASQGIVDNGSYYVAVFILPAKVTLQRIRVTNLLDISEIEVH